MSGSVVVKLRVKGGNQEQFMCEASLVMTRFLTEDTSPIDKCNYIHDKLSSCRTTCIYLQLQLTMCTALDVLFYPVSIIYRNLVHLQGVKFLLVYSIVINFIYRH